MPEAPDLKTYLKLFRRDQAFYVVLGNINDHEIMCMAALICCSPAPSEAAVYQLKRYDPGRWIIWMQVAVHCLSLVCQVALTSTSYNMHFELLACSSFTEDSQTLVHDIFHFVEGIYPQIIQHLNKLQAALKEQGHHITIIRMTEAKEIPDLFYK
ncbi:uncharacterized protein CIMG_13232 [Coccidioides immitis RS]|uniref:Uncharacterized protein n=1 Tax=Coccidioides immitis (strain RS) TaxID=246410 RepID=A0A0D8JV35_COCIM|nr:uncharacterized protein CIMG_13232 [Coccidioides immitis RS]KJF60791.1 hypothetical protein CIMG_13232 [Coccidioides immitis RS]